MSALTQQLEQLKKQQCDLEERIKKEEETKQKLENESSIERLEALVQPLTDVLERKDNHGTQIHPQWGKTKREQRNIQYNIDMQKFNKRLERETREGTIWYPPQKNKQLLEEEIYTTIISILKKQEERITALEEKNQMLLDENDSLKQQVHDMHLGHYCYSDKEYFPASKFS
tara:strand:- start:7227 stop:7742 length:516 start_codon:yes stop_codon:yes gene_type:complete